MGKDANATNREAGMLVLTRERDQVIVLTMPDGRVIRLLTVKTSASDVRLGIDAPSDVKIVREELLGVDTTPKQA